MARLTLALLVLAFVLVPAAVAEQGVPRIQKVVVEESTGEVQELPLDLAAIDEMLQDDEATRSGTAVGDTGERYEADARRDPFSSLKMRSQNLLDSRVCPPGTTSSLLIDEIEIQGIFETPVGTVAQVAPTPHTPSVLLREGDQLCDGEVVSISLQAATFKQQLPPDPTLLNPFRKVVKDLG